MFIVKAATMYSNGEVLEGRDYGHIANLARKLSYTGTKIDGFVTSNGTFVLPKEAAKIAVEAGQVENVDSLTPELLWPQGIMDR